MRSRVRRRRSRQTIRSPTIEPNVGEVAVPDERCEFCRRSSTHGASCRATVRFVDIAGLVRGASAGQGLGNAFLSHIRETDAVAMVVRCFEDDNVTHVEGHPDPGATSRSSRSNWRSPIWRRCASTFDASWSARRAPTPNCASGSMRRGGRGRVGRRKARARVRRRFARSGGGAPKRFAHREAAALRRQR